MESGAIFFFIVLVFTYFAGKYFQSKQEQRIAERVSKRQPGGDWHVRLELWDLKRELARRDEEIRDLRRRMDNLEKKSG